MTISRAHLVAILIFNCVSAFGQKRSQSEGLDSGVQRKEPGRMDHEDHGLSLGENYGNTFRVGNGLLKASYDQYSEFGNKFGRVQFQPPASAGYLSVDAVERHSESSETIPGPSAEPTDAPIVKMRADRHRRFQPQELRFDAHTV